MAHTLSVNICAALLAEEVAPRRRLSPLTLGVAAAPTAEPERVRWRALVESNTKTSCQSAVNMTFFNSR
jgi:hypothetical protein